MYLEIDEGFPRHRKTLRLAGLMRNPCAGMYMLQLWTWACRSCPDGVLRDMAPAEIEMIVGYTEGDGRCFEAMVKAGFIDVLADGTAVIHGWMERTGGALERMEARAGYMRDYRQERKQARKSTAGTTESSRKGHVTVTRTAREQLRDEHVTFTNVLANNPVQSSPDKTDSPPARACDPSTDEPEAPAPEPAAPAEQHGPVLPTSGYLLIHRLRVAFHEAAPGEIWDKGSWGDEEADEIFDGLSDADRAEMAPKLLERARAFAKSLPSDRSVKAFRAFLNPKAAATTQKQTTNKMPPMEL
jgi:hypothetical protein